MKHKLLFPNKAREYGIIVDNTPPHLDHTVTGTFTITYGDYNLPLENYGHRSYICLRRPSEKKVGILTNH